MIGRIIGIRHRTKKTKKGEARPTEICIMEGDDVIRRDLKTEDDELDFVRGRLPISWRAIRPDEDPKSFPPHHVRWRKLEAGEDVSDAHKSRDGKTWYVADRVPEDYDGLTPGDRIAAIFGGSGARFVYALARRADEITASVHRLPGHHLKALRDEKKRGKEEDALTLAEALRDGAEGFQRTDVREMPAILLAELLAARTFAMRDRIACESRLRTQTIGHIFTNPDGKYPEGAIADQFDEARANSKILQALLREEADLEKRIASLLESMPVYLRVFKPVEGIGHMTAARIIAEVGDIRRFPTRKELPAFRALCGVHLTAEGRFPRYRRGEPGNWSSAARQAYYLLGDQANRRPDSEFGEVLLRYKAKFRAERPETKDPETGKRRNTPGHTLKTALWRTRTKLCERIHREWRRFGRESGIIITRPRRRPSEPRATTPAVTTIPTIAPAAAAG